MSSTSFGWFVPAGDYTGKLSTSGTKVGPNGTYVAGRPLTFPTCHVTDPRLRKHTPPWSTPWIPRRFDQRTSKGVTLDWRAHLPDLTASMQTTATTTDQRRESEASLSKAVPHGCHPRPTGLGHFTSTCSSSEGGCMVEMTSWSCREPTLHGYKKRSSSHFTTHTWRSSLSFPLSSLGVVVGSRVESSFASGFRSPRKFW